MNRNGLVLCFNGTKIICIYLFYLIDDYVKDLIELFDDYENIKLDVLLNIKKRVDNRLKNKIIIEKRI